MTSPRARQVVLALVLGAALGCDSQPTQPALAPALVGAPGGVARSIAPTGGDLGSFTLPSTPDNYWLSRQRTGIVVPAFSSYIVTVTGTTTVTPNPKVLQCFGPSHSPPYGGEGTYGPAGYGAYDQMRVFFDQGALRYGASGDPTAVSDTLFAWGAFEVTATRYGFIGSIGNGTPECGNVGFYLYDGTQTFSVKLVDGGQLNISPKYVLVKRGTQVRFTGTDDAGTVVWSPNWTFTPKPGSTDPATATCGISGPNPCNMVVQGDGELRISKDLKGRMRSDVAVLRVYTSFGLEADRAQVDARDSVVFTPMVDGAPGTASRWVWRGDDKSEVAGPCESIVDGRCRYTPLSSGTMWAYTSGGADGADSASAHVTVTRAHVQLHASATAIAFGDTITFVADAPRSREFRVLRYYYTEGPGDPPPILASRLSVAPALSAPAPTPNRSASASVSTVQMCVSATDVTCIDDPAASGRQHVVAIVDGETQEAEVAITVAPPEATVSCGVAAPGTRGSQVECQFRVGKLPFTFTHQTSRDASGVLVDQAMNEERSPGQAQLWIGTALTNTTVTMEGRVRTSRVSRVVSGSAGFTVLGRIGIDPQWALPALPTPAAQYGEQPPLWAPYPGFVRTATGMEAPEGSLGVTSFGVRFEWEQGRGPNAGLWYFPVAPAVTEGTITVERSLRAGSEFARHQTGGAIPGVRSPRYCTEADVAARLDVVIRHEESHFAANRRAMRETAIPRMEEAVVRATTSTEADQLMKAFKTTVFDDVVTRDDRTHAIPELNPALTCFFRLPPNWK